MGERAQALLVAELTGKSIPANEIVSLANEFDISEKTLRRVKTSVGVRSYKKQNQWYWTIDGKNEEDGQLPL